MGRKIIKKVNISRTCNSDLQRKRESTCGINMLPNEILVKIFSYYLNTESHNNLLEYISPVSRHFKSVCMDRSLWRNVDNSLTIRKILCLCEKKLLKHSIELDLSNQGKKLTSEDLLIILESCPELKMIDLSNAIKLPQNTFDILPTYCPCLTHINLSNIAPIEYSKGLNLKYLDALLSICGPQLVHLNISYNRVSNFTAIMKRVAQTCPNLKELILLHVFGYRNNFPLEEFETKCPKLEILRMSENMYITISRKTNTCGFPNLEVFTYGIDCGVGLSEDELLHILRKSENLRLLDIRGCSRIKGDTLSNLPATDLEHLFLSKSAVCNSFVTDDMYFLKKWVHSLKELDISRSSESCVLHVLTGLSDCEPEIEHLNLSFTSINNTTLKTVLDYFPKLSILNLESCRHITRGIKRLHRGKDELQILKQKLAQEH